MPRGETTHLRKKGYEAEFDLDAMFEFSKVVNSSLDITFILGHLLLTIMGKLLSLRGLVVLRTPEGAYRVETVKGLGKHLAGAELTLDNVPRRLMYLDAADGRKMPWTAFFKEQGIHLIVPLIVHDDVVGIAGFAQGVTRKKFGEKEETYLLSLANIAAAAIEKGLVLEELRLLNRRLDGKYQELNTLFELSKEFNSVLDADRVVKLLMFSIMGQIGAARYALCLANHGAMEVVSSRLEKQIPQDLTKFFSQVTSPILVSSMTRKLEQQVRTSLDEIGLRVIVPLQVQNLTKGVLVLGDKIRGEQYSQSDLEFLSSLGNLAMISMENARLFKEAIERQKLEDELIIAKEIQQGLLPKTLPEIPRFDVAAINISSKQVGGDYYDVLALDENRFVLAIGDVSGKGTPASLLMANLQATIRALAPLDLSLSELTRRVNDLLCENTTSGRFITFFWTILDARSRELHYVSAGHNPPFLIRKDRTIERLEKGGIILGIMKTVLPYEQGCVRMNPGDVLVLFTDGVSESMNMAGEELGEQCIEDIGKECLNEPAETILENIVNAVRCHNVNTVQSDDITLLIAKATG